MKQVILLISLIVIVFSRIDTLPNDKGNAYGLRDSFAMGNCCPIEQKREGGWECIHHPRTPHEPLSCQPICGDGRTVGDEKCDGLA